MLAARGLAHAVTSRGSNSQQWETRNHQAEQPQGWQPNAAGILLTRKGLGLRLLFWCRQSGRIHQ